MHQFKASEAFGEGGGVRRALHRDMNEDAKGNGIVTRIAASTLVLGERGRGILFTFNHFKLPFIPEDYHHLLTYIKQDLFLRFTTQINQTNPIKFHLYLHLHLHVHPRLLLQFSSLPCSYCVVTE